MAQIHLSLNYNNKLLNKNYKANNNTNFEY